MIVYACQPYSLHYRLYRSLSGRAVQFLRLQNRPDSGFSNADSSKKRKRAPQKTVLDPSNLKKGDRVELKLFQSTHLLQITRTYQHEGTLGWFMDGIMVSTGKEFYEFACLLYADESRVHSKAASSTDPFAPESEHTFAKEPAVEIPCEPAPAAGTTGTFVAPSFQGANTYVEGGRTRQAPLQTPPTQTPPKKTAPKKKAPKKNASKTKPPKKTKLAAHTPTSEELKSLTFKQTRIEKYVTKPKMSRIMIKERKKQIMGRLINGDMISYNWKDGGWLRGEFVRISNGKETEASWVKTGYLLIQSYKNVGEKVKFKTLDHLNINAMVEAEGKTSTWGWHFVGDSPSPALVE